MLLRLAACSLAVFGPLAAQDRPPAAGPAEPVDFGKQVAPIVLQRCVECHGPQQQKGHLRLDRKDGWFPEGARDHWTVEPGKPDASEMIRRIGLPAGDDDVMPNRGEPLTKAQQDLLRQWVAEGAVWPADGDRWFADELAKAVLPKLEFALGEVTAEQAAAIERATAALREKGVVVAPVATGARALEVNASLCRDRFGDQDLVLVADLAPVLVWLDVSRTAVTDAAAARLATLRELRRFRAANTALGDVGFSALAGLPHLEQVNAHHTALGDEGLAALVAAPALRTVYAWQSRVTPARKQALEAKGKDLAIDLGDYAEARLAAAQKEAAARDARNQPINTTCPVLDKPADPNCTAEFEGRRIAFCCGKCRAAFLKEPQKFAAKLPK